MDQWSTKKDGPILKQNLKARLLAALTMLVLRLLLKADLNLLLRVSEMRHKLRQMDYPYLTPSCSNKSAINLHREVLAVLWVLVAFSESLTTMVAVSLT